MDERIDFLVSLAHLTKRQLAAAIPHFSKKNLLALRELALNVLRKVLSLPDHAHRRLKRFREVIRNLAYNRLDKQSLVKYAKVLFALLQAVRETLKALVNSRTLQQN